MLQAHGLVMNGGVLHAIEYLAGSKLRDAEAGYCFYGLDAVASLLSRARSIFESGVELTEHELQLDAEYGVLVPTDTSLVDRFEQQLQLKPSEFEPLRVKDMT
jgi:hypothetical protein